MSILHVAVCGNVLPEASDQDNPCTYLRDARTQEALIYVARHFPKRDQLYRRFTDISPRIDNLFRTGVLREEGLDWRSLEKLAEWGYMCPARQQTGGTFTVVAEGGDRSRPEGRLLGRTYRCLRRPRMSFLRRPCLPAHSSVPLHPLERAVRGESTV